jgi:hypothetical protein
VKKVVKLALRSPAVRTTDGGRALKLLSPVVTLQAEEVSDIQTVTSIAVLNILELGVNET